MRLLILILLTALAAWPQGTQPTAPAKATAAAPVYGEGRTVPLSVDLSGNLRTSGGGGGGGGTSSNFGAAFPTAGTAVGFTDGTNMRGATVFDYDTGAGIQYVFGVGLRFSAGGGSVEAGTLANPLRVDPTGTTAQPITASSLPLPSGAATEATLLGVKTGTDKIPASPATDRTTAGGPFAVELSDGGAFYKATTPADTQPISAASLPLPVGAATATRQDTGNASLSSIDGKIPASPATDRATAGGPFATRLSDGTAFYKATTPADTQPISAASLPLPSGAATESTLSGIKTGTDKIPASPATDRTTAGGPFAVELSDGAAFYKATTPADTQPVSAVSLPLPTGAATAARQDTGNTSLASIDTKIPASPATDRATAAGPFSVRISNGAAFITPTTPSDTQPISAASLPLPTGAATSANQSTEITSLQLIDDLPHAMNDPFGKGVASGGQLDDTATTAATENNIAPVRITAQRAFHSNLRDNSGAELGISSAPLQVSVANTGANATAVKVDGSAVTQPVSGTVTANQGGAPWSNNQTQLNSVALASPFDVDSGAGTQNVAGVSLRKAASGGSVEYGTSTDPLRVDPTGTTTQPVSATSLPLPSGASTSAKQPALGTAGAASADVITVQGIAGMTKLLVTPDSVALPANQSVNVSQINGVTPLMGNGVTGTGSQRVTIASDNTAFPVNATLSAETTKVIGTARIIGNGGATLDSTVGAGTAPSNAVAVATLYNSTAPTPTTGQALAAQSDQAGNLRTFPGNASATLSAWTSATALNATQNIFTNSGANEVLVHLVQTSTITAGAISFQASYDGTNWVTVPADSVLDPANTYAQITLPYTLQASTNKPFAIKNRGWQGLRIILTTQITGTGSVTPNYTLMEGRPGMSVVALQPTATNLNAAVVGTGTAGSPAGNILTVQGVASMTKLLVTPDSVALPANQSVNVAQIAGTNTVTAGVSGLLAIGGAAASGATKSGNPVQAGGVFNTTPPTVTTGQMVEAQYTARGEAHGIIRDAAGNLRGANVDANNNLGVVLPAETTKVIGTVRVQGNVGGAFDAATGAAPPANGVQIVGTTSGATGGLLAGITVCDSFANITQTAGAQIITGVAGRRIYVCHLNVVTATAQNIAVVAGTGTTCATTTVAVPGTSGGTTAATGWNFAANGGIKLGSGLGAIAKTTVNADNLCVLQSGSGQVSGGIAYAIY